MPTGDRGHAGVQDDCIFAFALDALGHGDEAHKVADIAMQYLRQSDWSSPLASIMRGCHERLRDTRGAAVCLARLEQRSGMLEALSVGNIQVVHMRTDCSGIARFDSLIMRAGVVGDRLPELRTSSMAIHGGDLLVMATDGIGYDWRHAYKGSITPRDLAETLIRQHCLGSDDALALALRFTAQEVD